MVPAKTHYACLAMVEMAIRGGECERPVALREITEPHNIPQPFLVQILQQLKIAGLVTSTRGSQGGYRLTRRPDEITLLDVVEAIGGDVGCTVPLADDTAVGTQINQVWQAVAESQREVLAKMRIGDLARASETKSVAMFYI